MIMLASVRVGDIHYASSCRRYSLATSLNDSGEANVNIFTAMIGTLVFGIGVDDAIHVMHRIQGRG